MDLYYNTTLNITTRFVPQETIFKESNQSNTAYKQISHICTQLT